ncbi:MAG: D-TA family PLP-dependent enzyme [Planctomycetes bacterium]|nr:D-TA family PLP-dependent enzyme [Planctomycetota bacterium]
MRDCYRITDTSEIISPALLVFSELLERNLRSMIEVVGDPGRLRPHCKTHKIQEIAELGCRHGIRKGKCATFAEAEMLARAGVSDIFLAYPLIGPNLARAVEFRRRYPDRILSVTADDPEQVRKLGETMEDAGQSIEVLLDIDTGQHRTGIPAGDRAAKLYHLIAETRGLRPGGLHVYDGHNHQRDPEERRQAVLTCWEPIDELRRQLVAASLPVPRIVAGGTGSFPIFATMTIPELELSPGTVIFHDAGYGEMFPDLHFEPAALLLTRVISRPTPERVTLDLGYKAIASDPPAGHRLTIPDLPDAKAVLQNEEHLVIETERAGQIRIGDEFLAIPRHVCPTTALHKQVYVIRNQAVVGTWNVVARDRQLTI